MMTLLAATALMNPFLPGLPLDAGFVDVEAALAENGWTSYWYGLMLRAERPGAVLEFCGNEDEEEPVVIRYAEAHPPDETRTAAYETWLDKLREMFGEPEAAVGFHHWETEKYHVHIVAQDYYVQSDFKEPAVVINITRYSKAGLSRYGWSFTEKWDKVGRLGVEVSDPFLPGLSLNEDTHTVLEALEDGGWAADTSTDRTAEGDFFILEGRLDDRLLRYTYYFTERLAEVVYAEPHPPDETRTAAYAAWLDRLKATFGEPEVVDSFHRWKMGGWSVDIAADDFDFGDGSPAPAVLITISLSA